MRSKNSAAEYTAVEVYTILGVRVRQRNFGNQGGGGKQILELVHQPQVAHWAGLLLNNRKKKF